MVSQKYLRTRINTSPTWICSGPAQRNGYVNLGIHVTHAFLLIHFKGSGSSWTSLGEKFDPYQDEPVQKNLNSCFYSGWLQSETLSLGHSYKDFLHLFGSHHLKKGVKSADDV